MIEDGAVEDDEIEKLTEALKSSIERNMQREMKKHPKKSRDELNWYLIVRDSIIQNFKWKIVQISVLSFFAESLAIFYTFFIS